MPGIRAGENVVDSHTLPAEKSQYHASRFSVKVILGKKFSSLFYRKWCTLTVTRAQNSARKYLNWLKGKAKKETFDLLTFRPRNVTCTEVYNNLMKSNFHFVVRLSNNQSFLRWKYLKNASDKIFKNYWFRELLRKILRHLMLCDFNEDTSLTFQTPRIFPIFNKCTIS